MNIWLLHYESVRVLQHHEYIVFVEPITDDNNNVLKLSDSIKEKFCKDGYVLLSATLLETADCRDFPWDVPIETYLEKLR